MGTLSLLMALKGCAPEPIRWGSKSRAERIFASTESGTFRPRGPAADHSNNSLQKNHEQEL